MLRIIDQNQIFNYIYAASKRQEKFIRRKKFNFQVLDPDPDRVIRQIGAEQSRSANKTENKMTLDTQYFLINTGIDAYF